MRLDLSDAEQRQLAQTARVLLSPLDAPTDRWRAEVLHHVTSLFGAEMGGFILPADQPPPYTLHNLPDSFAREYFESVQATDPAAPLTRIVDGRVWSTRSLVQLAGKSVDEGWFQSPAYLQFYSRYRIQEGIGWVLPELGAVLTCFHEVFGTPAFGERGLAIMRLLLPALEAGVAGRLRVAGLQESLEAAFDGLREGLQLCSASGRLLHANAALERMLAEDPHAEALRAATERVATALRALLQTPRSGSPHPREIATSSEIRTPLARYQVRGHLIGEGQFSEGPLMIIGLTRLTPSPPTAEELQRRWGLSPQEARVAVLLAQGWNNARIAAELGLSPTTARHYTEAVFLKLDVHARAEAARRLLMD